MRRSFVLTAIVYLAGTAPALTQTTTQSASTAVATHLDIQVNPLIDLHFFIRACAADAATTPDVAGFADAVRTAKELDQALGGPLAWGFIEAVLSNCTSVAEAQDACKRIPERFRTRSGQIVELRQRARQLVEKYTAIEVEFRSRIWPEHKRMIERAAQQIRAELLPKQAACFAEILQRLELPDPRAAIPVYLVAKAPPPGASTHKRYGLGVCFVSVDGADKAWSLLYEAILHESIHAIDVAAQGQPTVFADLKQRLTAAGITPRNPANRDAVHTIVFVQAAETVRRQIDPTHRHYGDVRGYYDRVGPVGQIVRRCWTAYLDGELTRDEALMRIVDEVSNR